MLKKSNFKLPDDLGLILVPSVMFSCRQNQPGSQHDQDRLFWRSLRANFQLRTVGKNGVLLAAEEINQAGGINGRKIDIVIEDDQGQSGAGAQLSLTS